MEFLKEFRRERQGRNVLAELSPDFQYRVDSWLFNRTFNVFTDGEPAIKTRFAFDDASELRKTDFQAKIGINSDRAIPHKFIGFAYGDKKKRTQLEEYARQYPWAELITNCDREGLSTDASEHIPLTNLARHD